MKKSADNGNAELNRLLRACKEGKCDLIIIKNVVRYSRYIDLPFIHFQDDREDKIKLFDNSRV